MGLSKWEKGIVSITLLCLGALAAVCLHSVVTERPLAGEWVTARTETEAPRQTEVPLPVEDEEKRVNLNTADLEELMTLPNIGEARAAMIIADREANGRFRMPEDLLRIKGFSDTLVEGLLEHITTEEAQ